MTQGSQLTTQPLFMFGSGGDVSDGFLSLPDVEQILFVDSSTDTTEDGTRQHPYQSIADAMTAAAALTPTATNRILIYILPGIYNEVLTAVSHVYLWGVSRSFCIVQSASTVYTVETENTAAYNLTFESLAANPIVSVDGVFNELVPFFNCRFLGAGSNSNVLEMTGEGKAWCQDCWFIADDDEDRIVHIDATAGNVLKLEGCAIEGYLDHDDGMLDVVQCEITSSGATAAIDSASEDTLRVRNSKIENDTARCIYITAQLSTFEVQDCQLSSAALNYDIDSNATRTGCDIEGNRMLRGIGSNIQTSNLAKRVGSNAQTDWYATLGDAISACPNSTECTIRMFQDETLSALITANSKLLTVDLQGFALSYVVAGDAFISSSNSDVTIQNGTFNGGRLEIALSGILRIKNCFISGKLLALAGTSAGSAIYVEHSRIEGSALTNQALEIRDDDPIFVIKDSYLKGRSGQVAVYWNSGSTNANLDCKHSAFMHGSLGANLPFTTNAGQNVTYSMHHCEVNADPQTAGNFTNDIAAGQQYLTITPLADY